MKRHEFGLKRQQAVLLAVLFLFSVTQVRGQRTPLQTAKSEKKFVHKHPGNPYLPLWEHVPDGEPRVFEDPDHPGKYRA
ncbi:MAG TPA: hypothetical protein VM888_04235, partial [Chitinophagaceae bacterium]|nr:hypothetical protein [Chitinophagaceae bacterium]